MACPSLASGHWRHHRSLGQVFVADGWQTFRSASWFIAMVVVATTIGCGRGSDARYRVTGVVLLDGKPLDYADIKFRPNNARHGTVAGRVKDGRYRLLCPAGEARVEIIASRLVSRAGDAVADESLGDPGGTVVETVPSRYHSESVLRFTVEPHNRNVVDFQLEGNR